MKKIVFFFTLFFAFASLKAQLPDFWTGDTDIETFQEATIIHGGSYSCGVIVSSIEQANCDLSSSVTLEVSGGDDYKISFWGYTSSNVRIRACFDWIGASVTYSSTYLGQGTNGWVLFEYSDVVPDGATGVKLRLRFYDTAGFTAPETQYVDDVQFQSPVGAALAVTNGDFEDWPTVKPEPSNYPTEFTATPLGLGIALSWTDATGTQLPDEYLVLASTQNNFTAPVDGVIVLDDPDLSDGNGAASVAFGEQTFSFTELQGQTVYYFMIYPYTNAGTSIDYKNDGTAPSSQATTANVIVLNSQNFDGGWGDWTTVSVIGDQVWSCTNTYGINATPCAQMSGYASGDFANEDWLISPAMNFDQYNNEVFTFYSACGYGIADHQLHVKISNDYSSGDPNAANWTDLTPVLPSGNPNWIYTYSGELMVSGTTGTNVKVAFVYISDGLDSETWEIDNVVITGEAEAVVIPEPTNYPANFSSSVADQTITLTWVDAIGETVPTGYLLKATTEGSLPNPVDGTPTPEDLDFSDGYAAVNIAPGVQTYTFSGLLAGTDYFFTIYPYTNSGSSIDYKTDATPPHLFATTEQSSIVEILNSTFNLDLEGWTAYSVTGDEVWTLDPTHGVEGTGCAKMSGYAGAAHLNEDWLISPVINLQNYIQEKLSFSTATNYVGPALTVNISTNYDGTGNPNDFTWIDLSSAANWPPSGSAWVWTNSGEISISEWGENSAYVAFKFTSTDTESATWEVDNVVIKGENKVGINENHSQSKVFISPNPSNGKFNVTCEAGFDQFEVYSLTGQLLLSREISGNHFQADLSDFQKGMYLIRLVQKESGNYTSKNIIIN